MVNDTEGHLASFSSFLQMQMLTEHGASHKEEQDTCLYMDPQELVFGI